MIKNSEYFFVTILAFVNIFFIGSTVFLLSATKMNLMEAYAIGLAQIGLLITVRSFVNIILPMVFGRLSDKIGRKPVIISGIVLLIGIYLAIPSFSEYHLLVITTVIMGVGFALVDATSQAVLFDAHKDPTPLMPFMQISFASGALSAPLMVSIFLERGIDWRIAYYTNAVLVFILLILLLKAKFPPLARAVKKETENAVSIFKKAPSFKREGLTLCAFIFFTSITNSTISEWGDIYFREVYGFSHAWSVRALSFFQIGCVLGAVVNFWLTSKRRIHAARLLNKELLIAIAAFSISLFVNNGVIAIILFVVIGMCVGTLFSMTVGIMGSLFRENAGTVTGAIFSSGSIGIALASAIVGNSIDIVGIDNVFRVLAFIMCGAFIMSLIIRKQYNDLVMEEEN